MNSPAAPTLPVYKPKYKTIEVPVVIPLEQRSSNGTNYGTINATATVTVTVSYLGEEITPEDIASALANHYTWKSTKKVPSFKSNLSRSFSSHKSLKGEPIPVLSPVIVQLKVSSLSSLDVVNWLWASD
jgi:hypothetical protein